MASSPVSSHQLEVHLPTPYLVKPFRRTKRVMLEAPNERQDSSICLSDVWDHVSRRVEGLGMPVDVSRKFFCAVSRSSRAFYQATFSILRRMKARRCPGGCDRTFEQITQPEFALSPVRLRVLFDAKSEFCYRLICRGCRNFFAQYGSFPHGYRDLAQEDAIEPLNK